jgi:hypothetical protein
MGEPYRSPTLLIYLKGGENDGQHSASLGTVIAITWTRPTSGVSFPLSLLAAICLSRHGSSRPN